MNPLHTYDWVSRQVIGSGYYDPTRCTGRSTALALEYLVKAIQNPNTAIQIIDHAPSSERQDRHLMHTTLDLANAMGLKFIRPAEGTRYSGRAYIVFGAAR